MAYVPAEVYTKKITFLGIPIWTSTATVSQEKFYELVSARVAREIDRKFERLAEEVEGRAIEKINAKLAEMVGQAKPRR